MAKRPKHQKVRPPSQDALESDWRLFVAIPMPDEVRQHIARVIQLLSHDDPPVRWIDPETAHLTLHFLGATAPERAELLRLALAEPVAKIEQFTLKTSGLGVFPNTRQPRVLWIGLDGETRTLERLHREVGLSLQRLGFEAETGKLRPHITLGRVRDNAPASLAAKVQAQLDPDSPVARITASGIQVPVNEVLLVRSFLDAKGARHVPIAPYPLTGQSNS
jgi:2'-5' RNA ligase